MHVGKCGRRMRILDSFIKSVWYKNTASSRQLPGFSILMTSLLLSRNEKMRKKEKDFKVNRKVRY